MGFRTGTVRAISDYKAHHLVARPWGVNGLPQDHLPHLTDADDEHPIPAPALALQPSPQKLVAQPAQGDQHDGQHPGVEHHQAGVFQLLPVEEGNDGEADDDPHRDIAEDGVDLIHAGDSGLAMVELGEEKQGQQRGHLDEEHPQVVGEGENLLVFGQQS